MPDYVRSSPRLNPFAVKLSAIILGLALPMLLLANIVMEQAGAAQEEAEAGFALLHSGAALNGVVFLLAVVATLLLWAEARRRERVETLAGEQQAELRRNALIATMSGNMIAMVGDDGTVIWGNASFWALWQERGDGVRGGSFVGALQEIAREAEALTPLRAAMALGETFDGEIEGRRGDQPVWCSVQMRPVHDGHKELAGYLVFMADVTARKNQERQLEKLAYEDPLTGLPNRARLLKELSAALENAAVRPALIYIKFPRAASMRGSLGHDMADELILAIAARLREAAGEDRILARLSASAFAVMAPVARPANAVPLAYTLQSVLSKPYQVRDREIQMVSSIGVSVADLQATDPMAMLRDAEIATQSVAGSGLDDVALFDIGMRHRLEERQQMETDLRRAIYFDGAQLGVAFQPIVDLADRSLVGFETLARWKHPDKGWVPPDRFIAVAEESGLIVPLWNFVFAEACRNLVKWQALWPKTKKPLFVSVNLSAKQFFYPGLLRSISTVVEMTGVDPAWVKLEITETGLMENAEAALQLMENIKALGFTLAIDDFGTGYSSLSYLQKLPVDDLKIDRSFTMNMARGAEHREIVRIINELGHLLGKQVIAEGIETEYDLQILRAMKCDYGQGYYFYKPMMTPQAEGLVHALVREADTKGLMLVQGLH